MIHATVMAALYLPDVARDGQVLTTKRGTLVVPGAGYTGAGPVGTPALPADGSEVWLYATGMVEVRLGPIDLFPTDASALDRDTNTLTAWAVRPAAAAFDPCAHFAVRMVYATDENDVPAATP